jgi:hypothetical protein
MSQDPMTRTHRVAVTVFLDADGRDEGDARRIGELAVRAALEAAGDILPATTYEGTSRTARVAGVLDTGAAFREGVLRVVPAGDPR